MKQRYIIKNTVAGLTGAFVVGLVSCTTAAAGTSCETTQGEFLPNDRLSKMADDQMSVLDYNYQEQALELLSSRSFVSVRDTDLADMVWPATLGSGKYRNSYLMKVCVYGQNTSETREDFDLWANSKSVKGYSSALDGAIQTGHGAFGNEDDLQTEELVYLVHLPYELTSVVTQGTILE